MYRIRDLSGNSFDRRLAEETNPRVDRRDTPDAHVFKVDLPGFRKEEVKVEFEDDFVLQISGERNTENGQNYVISRGAARNSDKFFLRYMLTFSVKVDEVRATMQNGVLTVVLPKKKAEYKAIPIYG